MSITQAQHTAINRLDRPAVVRILEDHSFQCYESESTHELRDALRSNIEDQTIDPCVLDA